ncbi:MAG: SDR family oxidoreductase [Martelella sp.]|uniref:SDR family oxidoreductase n=1 Tax=Martelella sp. TaxID=1969699 RepID=UPI003241E47E
MAVTIHLKNVNIVKGAIVSYTRALALKLLDRGICVNQVAPGPVATKIQLVFKNFDERHAEGHGLAHGSVSPSRGNAAQLMSSSPARTAAS